MNDVAQLTNGAGTDQETSIAVTAPEYWPLPWYLRDHKQVGYYARVATVRERIVLCSEAQEPEIQTTLGEAYQRVDSYILRPGLRLVLYTLRSAPENMDGDV
jgi:predicted membrane-bound mannosyltransferase